MQIYGCVNVRFMIIFKPKKSKKRLDHVLRQRNANEGSDGSL